VLSLPSSPVPVAAVALLVGLAAARVRRRDEPGTHSVTWRSVAGHGVPGVATAAVATVVWTMPVGTWAPATAGVLGVAVTLAPVTNGFRVRSRPPTPAEAGVLRRASTGSDDVRVADADGRITGYAAGNPLTGTVVVSAGALGALPPRAVAALVAHERAHHERRHALLRAGASATALLAGIGAVAFALSGATAVGSGVLAVLGVERLLAAALARRTEFVADTVAARRTAPRAVRDLLASLPAEERSPIRRLLAAHPTRKRRLARVRA